MRIIQMLPTLSFGDAVGNDTRAIRDILREAGYDTAIYAADVDHRLKAGEGFWLKDMPKLTDEDLLIYHGSTGSQLNFSLMEYGGRKVMVYHNITPPEFFRWYNPLAQKNMAFGYEGIEYLADKVEYCIADSSYNKEELRRMGYECPIDVCPILIPFEDYEREPDPTIMAQYQGDGWTNLLFVGRISPNKKQEDVIKAFYCYQRDYNPKSRLFLIGNPNGMERYEARLRTYAERLGIADKVIMPGHVKFDGILAYYQLADVFVCLSEHEGFCVPLVESMFFGVPIVAYGCCAVPETLGNGGLLLESKEPEMVAAAVNRVVTDESLRNGIAAEQKEMLQKYSHEVVSKQILACLKGIIE